MLSDHKENEEEIYTQGLGVTTKNQVEMPTPWTRLHIVNKRNKSVDSDWRLPSHHQAHIRRNYPKRDSPNKDNVTHPNNNEYVQ